MKAASAVLTEKMNLVFGKDSAILKNPEFMAMRFTVMRSLYCGEITSWADVLTLYTALIEATAWTPKIKSVITEKIATIMQSIDSENIPLYMPVNLGNP